MIIKSAADDHINVLLHSTRARNLLTLALARLDGQVQRLARRGPAHLHPLESDHFSKDAVSLLGEGSIPQNVPYHAEREATGIVKVTCRALSGLDGQVP